MKLLEGKVVLITGAGSGMGQTHAEVMAERGAKIVANDINEKGIEETVSRVQANGGEILASIGDITDPKFVDSMVATTIEHYGQVDVLVNNAGIGEHKDLEEISLELLDRMLSIHIVGPFLCAKAVVPDMKSRRYGKIINISSIWGMNGYPTASHYCAAKAALLGATKAWAKEFARDNIHVNAVAPGGC